jgi:hypothetical protein
VFRLNLNQLERGQDRHKPLLATPPYLVKCASGAPSVACDERLQPPLATDDGAIKRYAALKETTLTGLEDLRGDAWQISGDDKHQFTHPALWPRSRDGLKRPLIWCHITDDLDVRPSHRQLSVGVILYGREDVNAIAHTSHRVDDMLQDGRAAGTARQPQLVHSHSPAPATG